MFNFKFALEFVKTLTLCSPSSTFGTSARSPVSTFGTNTVAMHLVLNAIVLHLWEQWHCLKFNVDLFPESPLSITQVNFMHFHCH